jgi:hypothetical protein
MSESGIPRGRAYVRLHESVLDFLWKQYPEHCITLADLHTRRVVDLSIQRAARHGFYSATDVSCYASLMVFLGSYFDEDPQLPWVAKMLESSSSLTPSERMDRLRAKVVNAFTRIVGLDGEHYRRALLWSRTRSFEMLTVEYADGSEEGIRRWLRDLHVQKYVSLSDEAAAGLIGQARAWAERYDMASPAGVIVLTGLLLLLGSSIDRDPLHPWVRSLLIDESISDPMVKSRVLRDRGIAELERFMRLDRITRKR